MPFFIENLNMILVIGLIPEWALEGEEILFLLFILGL
jgi:hypothetical protein